jgi:Raf kinase inhibitor-like YbhB/YbcL family protein
MEIISPEFKNNEMIPKKFTCEGEDVSPKLVFSDVPVEAKSLVLIVDDPDAPMGIFDHWIAWNLAPQTAVLEEGAKVELQGKNGFGDSIYRGPCPPRGPAHRYFFRLFAVDMIIELPAGASRNEVEKAIKGHIIASAELIGLYQR